MLEMTPIASSNLVAVGYDPDAMLMQAQFKNGSVYSYANVEPDTYAAMMADVNPGKYFADIIKPQRQRYVFTRVI